MQRKYYQEQEAFEYQTKSKLSQAMCRQREYEDTRITAIETVEGRVWEREVVVLVLVVSRSDSDGDLPG